MKIFKKIYPCFSLSLIMSCSSLPEFKASSEASTELGHWSVKLDESKDAFDVFVRLPKTEDRKFRRRHLVIAAAKTCKGINKPYFDISGEVLVKTEGQNQITKVLGLCFDKALMPAINITFTAKPRVLENTLAEEVEDTNAKVPTFFAVGDLVTKVNGQAITSNYSIRKTIFSLWTKGVKSLPVEVIRGGKTLTFNEPILEVKNDWSVERVSSLNNLYRP